MRVPMVRKIIQWVRIDGTRWRNEFVNGHENHGVGVHYGVAAARRARVPPASVAAEQCATKRFLGVHYETVSAQPGHIQASAPLFRAKDLPVRDRARSAAA